MESFEAQAVILAPSSIVRDILTDQGNYPVWNSGIAGIEGDIVHGANIRVRLTGGKRTLPLRVKRFDGDRMEWTGRRALGLLTFVRTFTVTDHSGLTLLKVRDTFSAPLWKLLQRMTDGTRLPLPEFVDEVKFRAELLGFHFHDGISRACQCTAAKVSTALSRKLSTKLPCTNKKKRTTPGPPAVVRFLCVPLLSGSATG